MCSLFIAVLVRKFSILLLLWAFLASVTISTTPCKFSYQQLTWHPQPKQKVFACAESGELQSSKNNSLANSDSSLNNKTKNSSRG